MESILVYACRLAVRLRLLKGRHFPAATRKTQNGKRGQAREVWFWRWTWSEDGTCIRKKGKKVQHLQNGTQPS